MPVLPLLLFQNVRDGVEGLRTVNHAGGVHRVVDQHRLGAGVDFALKVGQIRLEAGQLGIHLHHPAVPVADVAAVLSEVGPEHHHIVLHIQNGLEHDVDGARSAHGHDNVFIGQLLAVPAVQMIGHRLTDLGIAGVVHIAVERQGILALHQLHQRLVELRRNRRHRIAQGKIIDIFRAHPLGKLLPFNKHLADGRRIFQIVNHLFRKHFVSLLLSNSSGRDHAKRGSVQGKPSKRK